MYFPLITKTLRPKHCDPLYLLRELGLKNNYCALLESVDRTGTNDFTFLAIGARDVITMQNGYVRGSRYVVDGKSTDALSVLNETINLGEEGERLRMGYIGFISYEAVRKFENIDLTPSEKIPDSVFILPEVLLKINHETHEIIIILHKDSNIDLEEMERVIHSSPFFDDTKGHNFKQIDELPMFTLEEMEPFRQTTRDEFCDSVKKAQKKILDGEIFQVVVSQELILKQEINPDLVYEYLRQINPSPYMYYFQTPQITLVGASPETLVRVDGRNILYKPIAGTRKRTSNPKVNKRMKEELLSDEKERCEHQMLVDLGRNDVGKVSEIGSVKVNDQFHIEKYAHVYHIVTEITGKTRSGLTSLDVVRSVFPAGTLTGAPKIRAMEIIKDLEKSPRGIYGGAFGYIDLAGNVDFAITIRTMLFQDNEISLRVGAGIVKDSVPEHEDNECLFKARSCLAAIKLANNSKT